MPELNPSPPSLYTVGGTVQAAGGRYLSRKVDEELFQLCRGGKFAYILTTRQVGKSSLVVETSNQLRAIGTRAVVISLELLGVDVSAEGWYLGLLVALEDVLGLKTDAMEWWEECKDPSMTQRLERFFREVLLKEISDKVVIFIDEIDTTLKLSFSDDFFAVIRYLYLNRSQVPEFNRISFVLIGVANSTDLIKDPHRTPFNIGERVELRDFSFQEAMPLASGFQVREPEAKQLLRWALEWTGGHPVLTQELCRAIAAESRNSLTKMDVDRIVQATFFGRAQGRNDNLQFVREMLTRGAGARQEEVLLAYRKILLAEVPVVDDHKSPDISHLRLAGLVRDDDDILYVRNRIYGQAFGLTWIDEQLTPLAKRLLHLERYWPLARKIIAVLVVMCVLLTIISINRAVTAVRERDKAVKSEEKAIDAANLADKSKLTALESEKKAVEAAAKEKIAAADAMRQARKEVIARLGQRRATQLAEQETAKANVARLSAEEATRRFKTEKQRADDSAKAAITSAGQARQSAKEAGEKNRLAEKRLHDKSLSELNTASMAWDVNRVGTVIELLGNMRAEDDLTFRSFPARFLWRQSHPFLSEFRGGGGMNGGAFTPDGKRLAVGCSDGQVRFWDIATKRLVRSFTGTKGQVVTVAISRDGKTLAAATIGQGTSDSTVSVWNLASGKKKATFANHDGYIYVMALSPNGQRLASAGWDHKVNLWNMGSEPASLTELRAHKDHINTLSFSPDGNTLISGDQTGEVAIWQPTVAQGSPALWHRTGRLVSAGSSLMASSFSPDGKFLAIGGTDNLIRIWDVATKKVVGQLPGHTDSVLSVAYSPDGTRLASAGGDQTVRIWNVSKLHEIGVWKGHTDTIRFVAYSPNGQFLASGGQDSSTKLWPASPKPDIPILQANKSVATGVQFSPDSKLFASCGYDESNAVKLWDSTTQRQTGSLAVAYVGALAFSPNSKLLCTGGEDAKVRVWDVGTRKCLITSPGGAEPIVSVAFSPDGRSVASGGGIQGGKDFAVRLWDINTRKERVFGKSGGHTGVIRFVAFSPNGKVLASGSWDRTVRLWDVASGRQIGLRQESDRLTGPAAFTPDGRALAYGGWDGKIRTVSVLEPSKIGIVKPVEWKRHAAAVFSVAFSPDGAILASGGWDRKVKLTDVATGKEISSLVGNGDLTYSVAFSGNGRFFASCGDNGTVRLYEASPPEPKVKNRISASPQGPGSKPAKTKLRPSR